MARLKMVNVFFLQNNYFRNSFFNFFTLFLITLIINIYNIMNFFLVSPFINYVFMLASSPLGGQARGKPRYPT
jgi:hypothetical protein